MAISEIRALLDNANEQIEQLSGEKVDKEVDCVPETAEAEAQTEEDFSNVM